MRRYFALIWLLILTSILGCLFIEPVHAASVSVIVRLAAQVPTVTYDGQSEANGYAGLQDFNLNGPNSKNNGTPTAGDLEPIHAAGCMLKAAVSDMAAALPMLASGGLAAPAEGLAGGLTAGADTAAEAGTAASDTMMHLTTAADTAAADAPYAGQTLYRVYGGDSAAGGASWSPVNPGSIANYRDAAGLPSGGASGFNNAGRFVIEGTLQDPAAVLNVRSALPLDGNSGGILEYVIPNWQKQAQSRLIE